MILRLLTGGALAAVFVVLIWVPVLAPVFAAALAVFALLGAQEYFGMTRAAGVETEGSSATVAIIALLVTAYFAPQYTGPVFAAGVIIVSLGHILRAKHTLSGLAATVFGIVYIGLFPSFFLEVHETPVIGAGLLTLGIAAVVLSDTGAYFTGKAIGRTKLAPRVSPKKTWEGSVGGVIWALVGMGILFVLRDQYAFTAFPDWSLPRYLVTGGVIAVVGQIGDLVESLIKRDAGVKDSGTIFPGHGGALDRCDGLLFAAPVLYYAAAL